MKLEDKLKSVLKLNDVIVNEIQFSRSLQEVNTEELSMKIAKNISYMEVDDVYKVDLSLSLEDSQNKNFKMYVNISGFFEICINENISEDIKNSLLNKNTLSILFPYLRSQITLITSQPGMQPIIVPPININALLEE